MSTEFFSSKKSRIGCVVLPVAAAIALLFALWFFHENPRYLGMAMDRVVQARGGPASLYSGGGFVDSGQELGGAESMGVALGDLDGDGDLDAFVANGFFGTSQPNQVWINNGGGMFSPGPTLGLTDSLGVDLEDLDGDGDLDAFVANNGGNKVWINQGGIQGGTQGEFLDSGQVLGLSNSRGVALGNLDGDGDLDAVEANYSGGRIWINPGDGTFAAGQNLGASFNSGVALGDLDQDGDFDIVFSEGQSGSQNQVFWNDGTAVFTAGATMDSGALAQGVALGDLDGDGRLDIVFATSGLNAIWWNEGNHVFSPGPSLWMSNLTDVVLGDFDRDEDLDIFGTRRVLGERSNLVFVNTGERSLFKDEFQELGQASSFAAAIGDLVGDGDLDIFVANSGPNRVWLNDDYGGLDLTVFRRVRDEILATTITGTQYVTTAYTYKPEIMGILALNSDIRNEGTSTLLQWQPLLQALVDGQGSSVVIKQEQVQAADDFLTELSLISSPELSHTIILERERLESVQQFVGMTMEEARGLVVGYPSYDHNLYLPMVLR